MCVRVIESLLYNLYFLNIVIDVATDDDEEESLLQVTPREGLRMLDQLVFVTGICEYDRIALFSVKERMETLAIAYKKQNIN